MDNSFICTRKLIVIMILKKYIYIYIYIDCNYVCFLDIYELFDFIFSKTKVSIHMRKIIRYSRSTINACSLLSHEWWVPP